MSRMSISSVTIGSPVSRLGLGEQPQALLAEPLEGVRARSAACRRRRAAASRRRRARRARSRASARATRPCTGPAISAKLSPPILRPPMSSTVRSPCVICAEASLYGLRIGTTRSTPGWPSSPRLSTLASCSTSPIAPITVTRAPSMRWARAPARSIFSTTAATSSRSRPPSSRSSLTHPFNWRLGLAVRCSELRSRPRCGASRLLVRGARTAPRRWRSVPSGTRCGPATRSRTGSRPERLAKSPGVERDDQTAVARCADIRVPSGAW